eukprot:Em0021g631a
MAHVTAQNHSPAEQASGSACTIPLLRRPRPPVNTLKQYVEPKSDCTRTEVVNTAAGESPAHPTPLSSSTPSNWSELMNATEFPLVHALYPRGPDLLPPGRVIKASSRAPPSDRRHVRGDDVDLFTLDDFQQAPETLLVPKWNGYKALSRENYLKITGWFAANGPKQEFINTVKIEADLQAHSGRKPRQQIMLELQSMLQQMTGSSVSISTVSSGQEGLQWPAFSSHDAVFRSSTSRYFCGEGRSSSPFDAQHQPLISPAEVAVLDCMMQGGGKLTLKAHFLPKMPDICALSCTLTFLNISYNDFTVFPSEILQLPLLVCLRMRCNPIRSIPDDIKKLKRLEIFCASFNLLTALPSGLFELESLVQLDVSHNSIPVLPRGISKLRNLKKLDLSANQLTHLPPTFLSLSLAHLELSNNYLHPVFWITLICLNNVQSLSETCCVLVSKCSRSTDFSGLAQNIQHIMQRHRRGSTCDCCGGLLFGEGVKVMRSSSEYLGLRNLPILFTVCSMLCKGQLRQKPLSHWFSQ